MRHDSSSPRSSCEIPSGITVIGTDNPSIPEGCVDYNPKGKHDGHFYKTDRAAIGVCKRLMKTRDWNLGESFEGFWIWQDSWRVEDGLEKTWTIFFR